MSLVSPVELNYKLWVQVLSLVSKPGGRPGARGGRGEETNKLATEFLSYAETKLKTRVWSFEFRGGGEEETNKLATEFLTYAETKFKTRVWSFEFSCSDSRNPPREIRVSMQRRAKLTSRVSSLEGGRRKETNSQQSFLVLRKLNSQLVSGVSSLV